MVIERDALGDVRVSGLAGSPQSDCIILTGRGNRGRRFWEPRKSLVAHGGDREKPKLMVYVSSGMR